MRWAQLRAEPHLRLVHVALGREELVVLRLVALGGHVAQVAIDGVRADIDGAVQEAEKLSNR